MSDTSEDWKIEQDPTELRCVAISAPSCLNRYWVARELDKEDASRIVACVNACKGIDTAALEAMPLGGLAGTRSNLSAAVGQIGAMADNHADLAASHARLLTALQWYVDNDETGTAPSESYYGAGRERALAAIALAPAGSAAPKGTKEAK